MHKQDVRAMIEFVREREERLMAVEVVDDANDDAGRDLRCTEVLA